MSMGSESSNTETLDVFMRFSTGKAGGNDDWYKRGGKETEPSDLSNYRGPFTPCHSATSSMEISATAPSSPGASPSPSVVPWLLKWIESLDPSEIESLVNALRLATRRMIIYEAMTCIATIRQRHSRL